MSSLLSEVVLARCLGFWAGRGRRRISYLHPSVPAGEARGGASEIQNQIVSICSLIFWDKKAPEGGFFQETDT